MGETAGVTQDVGSDPTVGLPDFCTLCGQEILCFLCAEEPCSEVGGYEEVEDEDRMEDINTASSEREQPEQGGGCKRS